MTDNFVTITLELKELRPDPTAYKKYGALFGMWEDSSLEVAIEVPSHMVSLEPSSHYTLTPQGLVYVYNYLGFLAEQAERNQPEFNKSMLGE